MGVGLPGRTVDCSAQSRARQRRESLLNERSNKIRTPTRHCNLELKSGESPWKRAASFSCHRAISSVTDGDREGSGEQHHCRKPRTGAVPASPAGRQQRQAEPEIPMAHDKTPASDAGQTAPSPEVQAPLSTTRRRFLTGSAAAVGAAAAVGFPSVAVAQTTTLRFQSTWPNQDIFHEFASDYVRIVNEMSGGRLRLNLLPAGAVVGALQLQDAVISGALDGGHGVTAYWYGKHKAFSLFGPPPPPSAGTPTSSSPGSGPAAARSSMPSCWRCWSCRWWATRPDRCPPRRWAGSRSRSPAPMTCAASSTAPWGWAPT